VTPIWKTAPWTYVRFHGGYGSPRSCYGNRALQTWATRLRDLSDDSGDDSYAFFNNDHQGCALRDAAVFGRLLGETGVPVRRVPDVGGEVLSRPGD
jgi:uncharacterized protein YecE (DUF72 family)